MSLQRVMPWLVAMLITSVAGMAVGGMARSLGLLMLSAATFCGTLIVVAFAANSPYWTGRVYPYGADEAAHALRRNARLMTITYAWAAFAMQVLHLTPLTGIKWQHGWQYAMVLLLLALGSFHVGRSLGDPDPARRSRWLAVATPLTIASALLAAAGLVFLVVSGKLLVRRADWAANQIFLFAALTVMVLAGIALRTHARLSGD